MAMGAEDVDGPVMQRAIADADFDSTIRAIPAHLLGAPDHDFLDPDFSVDPFTPLMALRERSGPVVRLGQDGLYNGQAIANAWGHDLSKPHFVVLGHAAATEVGTDKNRFINAGAYGAHEHAFGRTVNTLDGEEHRVIRRVFDKLLFGRKAISEWAADVTYPTANFLIKRMKRMMADGELVDARRDLALPLTYTSISAIIGVPQADLGYFVDLGERAQSGPRNLEDSVRAIGEMADYFRAQLQQRRRNPRLDMLSVLGTADDNGYRLSDDQIVQHCLFLLPGGIETTWRATANMVMSLMLHPDQYREVVADHSLIDSAVEESLRWAPSGFIVPRMAANDTSLACVEIPAGSSINTIQGVANRDPAVFADPDRFDIRRKPNPHLTFHTGPHFCMGQNLARFSLREALRKLVEQLPTLQLACDPSEVKMQGFGVRCPDRLPLTAQL